MLGRLDSLILVSSMQTQTIAISFARNIDEVCTSMAQQIDKLEKQGWKCEKAYALVEGYRNEYELARDGDKMKLCFDLKAVLPQLKPVMVFTIASMSLAMAGGAMQNLERNLEASRRMSGRPEPVSLGGWVFAVIFAIVVLYFAIQYGRNH